MTVWLLLAAALIAVLLWTLHVRRVMRQRQEMVVKAKRQREKYRRKARRGRSDAVLERSEHIYRQSLALYRQGLEKPLYRPFAILLGFRPMEEDAAGEQKKEEYNEENEKYNGGVRNMQKTEKMSNIRIAMYEMFGVGGEKESLSIVKAAAAEETADTEACAVPAMAAEPAAVPAAAAPCSVSPVSFLAEDCVWEGALRSEGDVEISCMFRGDITARGCVTLHATMEGNVEAGTLTLSSCALTGNVVCGGTVIISRDSVVTGNVTAKDVRCAGQIAGDLLVSDTLALESTARITGDTTAGSISVAQGAVLCGGVEIKADR